MSDNKEMVFSVDPVTYNKIKVGKMNLDHPTLNSEFGFAENLKARLSDINKNDVIEACVNRDYEEASSMSNTMYNISGIYKFACDFLAFLYRYDYYIIPIMKKKQKKSILDNFYNVLNYCESSNIKSLCRRLALEVVKSGCVYGYLLDNKEQIVIQDLPKNYCRSRYGFNNRPVVEFNMKYFDDAFRDEDYKQRILKSFPKEFQIGYNLYKKGKLVPDYSGDKNGWYLLDINRAFKINMDSNDFPILFDSIPAIIDLLEAQEIDKEKMKQELVKILINKLPLDKNGELLFDPDEIMDIHQNAVGMLKKTIGVNVFTTFSDVKVEDVSETKSTTRQDNLSRRERSAYNEMGISQNVFNPTGNLALSSAIVQNANTAETLIHQFQDLFTRALALKFKNKSITYKCKFLETTHYNYTELSKLYKEQIQYGYSKLLPQLALGHSQQEILSELSFENEVLNLNEIMVPAASSNTMSNKTSVEEGKRGRKELPDDQKSDKTLKNLESES